MLMLQQHNHLQRFQLKTLMMIIIMMIMMRLMRREIIDVLKRLLSLTERNKIKCALSKLSNFSFSKNNVLYCKYLFISFQIISLRFGSPDTFFVDIFYFDFEIHKMLCRTGYYL
jgi:hypothetical protein